MASLPPELITEILIHLPVKSLTRFLCVQKSWYSLIKTPNFIKRHLNQTLISSSETYLILSNRSIYISDFTLKNIHNPLSFSELHYPLKPYPVHVIGSCNGILCISDFARDNVFLYNPLTKSQRKVPVKYFRDLETDWNDRVLYGFGYDSVTDDYKVFCFFHKFNILKDLYGQPRIRMKYEVEVFSFKGNCWKPVNGVCNIDFNFFADYSCVYLNEAVYSVVYKLLNVEVRQKSMVKFDFRTDTLLPVKCPEFDDKLRIELILSLSVLNGCLCVLVSYFPDGTDPVTEMGEEGCPLVRADLWMMKECGENVDWVRLFSMRDPCGIGIERVINCVFWCKDGNRILLEVDGSKIGWYDLEKGCFETIDTTGLPELWKNSALCYFSGSLVSLVDDELEFKSRTMTKKKRRNSDNFLSTGFKLKL